MSNLRTIKLTVEYDGMDYSGWQRQDNAITIQQKIEEALEPLFQQPITIEGSGRTDAGVHAIAQIASFHFDDSADRGIVKHGKRLDRIKLRRSINSTLPNNIVITDTREMPTDFHARFSAKGKRYRYLVLNRSYSSAFYANRCWYYPYPLSLARMRQAGRLLKGRKSFRAFTSQAHEGKSYVRNLHRVSISQDGPWFTFVFEADGFLYNMIRNIVGTLTDTGKGIIEPKKIAQILESEQRRCAGTKAPPQGLYLEKVFY